MKKSILEVSLSIFVIVLAVTPGVMAQEHFDWAQTDANMSVLITGATIDDESVVQNDEIGIFTPNGLCAGGAVVPEDFPDEPMGSAAFGAEQGQNNGFQAEDDLNFRIWDHEENLEVIADFQVENDAEPIYVTNGFIVLSLSAERPGAHFEWRVTDTNMSILIMGAEIAGESLTEGDEIGAFTEDGLCAGGGVVPGNFPDDPMGVAVFGSEPEQDNGFQANEAIEFRLWDHVVGAEVAAEMNVIRGEPNYVTNGLLILSLEADAPPAIVLSEDAHDFGVVNIGESDDWAFTISSEGDQDLVITSIESTVNYFSVDFEDELTLAPDESEEFVVTFAPEAEGDLEGAIRIFSNDPNDGIISISLTGAGYRVIPPTIVLSVEGLEFRNIPVGMEESGEMTITNEGDELLVIEGIVIDNESFSSDIENQVELERDQSIEVTFTFHPQESGDFDLLAIIQCNDPENEEAGFRLIGTGFVAGEDHHFDFVETGNSKSIIVTEALLDGEPLIVNDEIGVFTPDGLCAGSDFVTEEGIGISAWGAEQGQDNGFQNGEVMTFVYYAHEIDQEFLAIAEVVEGDLVWEADALAIITLSGLSVPPDIFIEQNEHDFGVVRVGLSSEWTFAIDNSAQGDLLITNVEVEGEYYDVDFQDMVVIEFENSHEFTVTFTPEDEGEFNTTLRVTSNDPDEHVLEISILGGGVIITPPTIELSSYLLDFERVFIDEVAELPLRITNLGDEPLFIEAIDLEEGAFDIDFRRRIEIPGEEFVDLTVTFEPEEADDYVGEMVVRSNDQDNGELAVTLWGSGFDPEQDHFEWEQTDSNLSILILAATLNGDPLEENDEVGVFNEAGLCSGGGEVPVNFPDEPMGIAAFGAEQDMENGFVANEPIAFRIWDFSADFEVEAEAEGVNGEVIFVANGFLVVNLSAEGQQGGDRPIISLPVEDYDFGEVRPGSSTDWEFYVQNSGRENLIVTGIEVEGDRFSANFEEEVELEFGQRQAYTVNFSPEDVGEYEGVVHITSNDPVNEVVDITLAGLCEEAPLPPAISVDPGALDFGRAVVGEQLSLPVTISNEGEEPLIIEGIDVPDENFSSNFENEFEIAEGEAADVQFIFEPNESGELEAIGTIRSNDPENGEVQVALAGLGFIPGEVPHYEFAENELNMSILITGATLDGELLVRWDEVAVFTPADLCAGGGFIPEDFPDQALGIAAWGAEQGEENGFQVGENIEFRVWDHMAEVEAIADITVINGVAPVYQANGFLVVELEAHSRATPNMEIDDEPHDFGVVAVGEVAEWNVEIRNTGEADLIIGEMVTDGAYFTVNFEEEAVVEPDAQIEFVVTFAPEEEGVFEGTLWMATNDPDYNVLEIQLIGRTFEPQEQQAIIVVEPDELAFGRVIVNEERTLALTISNEGDDILVVDAVDIDNEVFTSDFEGEFEVEPGANTQLNVTFTPDDGIDYQGNLVIGSNDPDNEAFAVQLTGSGVIPGEDRHFRFPRTDANMSILVMEALLNGESLVENDEIGVFTPDGVCAGGSVITPEFPDEPVGIAAWGAEQGQNNGFEPGEPLAFRVWDFDADFEVEAEFQVRNGVDPEYVANGFLVIEMTAEGEPEPRPDIFLPEDSHDFGVVPVGESGEWNMTIENHGEGDLIILDMDIVGRHFSVDFDEEVIIAAENGSEFTLGFTPEEDGVFEATLQITSNDPQDDLLEVTLTGRTEEPGGAPVIIVEPAELNFGRVIVDDAGVRNLTITNEGEEDLVIDAMDLEEGAFSVDFEAQIQVAGGESVEIPVVFEPVAREEYAADLTIHSNDPENPDIIVALSGTGFVPGEDVFYEFARTDANMSILVMEAILNGESLVENDEIGVFTPGGLCAGGSVIPAEFPDEAVGVAAWGAEQGQENGFAVGDEITFHVYDLDTGLEGEAAFEVINGVEPVYQANGFMVVTISAELEAEPEPAIEVNADAHDFGEVEIGDAAEWMLVVSSVGDADLVIEDIMIEGDFFLVEFGEDVILAPDESAEFAIVFAPEAEGEFNARLTISSNAGQVDIALSGQTPMEPVPPAIIVDPEAIDFGDVELGNARNRLVTISNNGEQPLTVDAINLDEGAFSVDFNDPIEIEGGGAVEITVTFAPEELGDFDANMAINSNDPDNDVVIVALTGSGVEAGQDFVWEFERTDVNMSILVMEALLNGESLVEGDRIGVFTPAGLCGGFSEVPAGFPDDAIGVAAWGAEQGQENGFQIGEDLNFRVWDVDADIDVAADAEVINGVEPVFAANGFLVVNLNAEGEQELDPPAIVVDPQAIDFGDVEVGRNRSIEVTIGNNGDENLVVEAVDLEEGVFAVDFNEAIEIEGGAAVVLAVTFTPEAVEDFAAEMTIRSNDPDNGAVVVALVGTGIEEGQRFDWDFERTDVNMSILVMEALLNGESLVEGDFIGVFTPAGLCAGNSEVPAGFPDEAIGVAAWGAEQGQENGFQIGEDLNFRVWDVDADIDVAADAQVINGVEPVFAANGFLVVNLSAEGEVEPEPDIVVEEDAHDFGEVAIGDAAEWQMNVANAGDADLMINAMVIDGDYFTVNFGEEIAIAPGEASEFTVIFSPEEEGEFAATLTIQSNDGNVDVALSGRTPEQQVDPPMIVLDPEALEFGRVAVDGDRSLAVTITNGGDELLVIDAIDLEEGVFNADFNDPIEIEGGQAFELVVTFAPIAAEDYAADMTINSNDPENDAVVLPLAGTGFIPGEEPHFVFDITDVNMSMLVTEALLNDETLVEGDEIGAFTNGGLCAGGSIVPAVFPDEPMGVAGWGAEQGQENGFVAGEDLNFRFWDFEAEAEFEAEIVQVVNGIEPVFVGNGFIVLRLAAEGEVELDPPAIVVDPQALDFGDVELDDDRSLEVTIGNNGDEILVVDAVDLEDGVFVVDFNEAIEVEGGAAVVLTVTFTPEAVEDYAADMTIRSNDPDNDAVVVALAGSGVEEGQEEFIWEFDRTDVNMSILVMEALLNGESLVEGNRVGVFTPAGLCGGFSDVGPNFPDEALGVAAWGAEQGQENGFQPEEELNFRLWDGDAGLDVAADVEVINGVEPVFIGNGFLVVNLSAEGDVEPEPDIVVEEDAHDFGEVAIGDAAEWQMNVANAGDADLMINAMVIDGDYFTVNFGEEIAIAPGEASEFTVTFSPEEEGEFVATLTIQSNDGNVDVALSGNTPEQQVDPPTIVLDPEALDFGRVAVEDDRSLAVTITNGGDELLIIDAIDLEEGVFTVDFNDPIEIEGGQAFELVVTFAPEAAEDYAADMTINSNDPENGAVVVPLAGTGFIPGEEPHFQFDITDINMSMLITEALLNDESLVEGDEIGAFTNAGLCAGGSIVPAVFPDEPMGVAGWGAEQGQENGFQANEDLNFRFWDFEAEEEFEAEIVQVVNGIEPRFQGNGFIVLRLAAEGEIDPDPPIIDVDPQAIDFGVVEIGDDVSREITIGNNGDEMLVVDAIDLAEGVFTVNFNDPIEIEGGDAAQIVVTFTPEAEEDYAADMTINSNDPENDAVIVALAGSGVEAGQEFLWEFERTDVNMSILVMEALLNDESLVEGDRVGVFTQAGLCAGFSDVEADFPDEALGLAAWGAEQGQENGFQIGEDLNFRLWDQDADLDVAADVQVINGVEPIFAANGFLVVNLSGAGQVEPEPEIVVEDAHEFGEVEIGDNAVWQMNVANAGDADLVIDTMIIEGDHFTVDFDEEVIIAAGDESEFTITFAPEEEGEFAATLTIQSNDGDIEVALSGSTPMEPDEPPMIALDPEALEFGRVAVDGDRTLELMITNGGDELLVIDAVDLEEGVFTVDFNDPIPIEGGQAFGLEVTFAPDAAEDFAADMTIHSNDPDNDAVVVPLAGTGFVPGEDPHFVFDITDVNMSVLITEALLGGESLIANDEVGLFTNDGLCAGGGPVPEEFPDEMMGIAAWGAEQGQGNGFEVGEDLNFRFWDLDAELEIEADITEVVNGVNPVFAANGFILVRLAAEVEPEPDIFIEDDAHHFGRVNVGEEAEWLLNINNNGEADLVINAMEIEGQYFTVNFDQEVILQPNQGRGFMTTFAPEEEGFFEATLTITSNDPDEGVIEFMLTGTTLEEDQPPVIVVSDEDLNFGQVFLGQERNLELTISNDGDEFLMIDAIDLGNEVFSTDFQNVLEVPGGESGVLTVTFTPDERGLVEADMTIHSNDPDNDAVVVGLAGFGFDPEEDRHFEFGITDVNMSILITEATLNEESLVENDEVGLFTNAGLCAGGDRVPANFPDEPMGTAAWGAEQGQENGFAAEEELNFRFWDHAADYEVVVEEVIVINGVDPVFNGNGFMVCELHAVGAPDVEVSDLDHDFGPVLIGSSVDWNFTITNTGFGDLIIPAMEAEGLGFSVDFEDEVTIATGESSEFTITFAPEEVMGYEGTVTITTNVEGNEEIVIDLTGSGTEDREPEITLERDRLNFGVLAVGDNRMLELIGENTGNGVLEIAQLEIAGDGFSIEVEELQVDPHQEFIIEVTFTPEEVQVYNGSLTIFSNDPDNGEVVVALTGEGIDIGENEPPEVVNPIDDVARDEDEGAFDIVDLDDVFMDPDDDNLEFSFEVQDDDNLGLAIDGNNVLSMNPVEHYFNADGLEVTIIADDGQGQAAFVMQLGNPQYRNVGRGIDFRSRSMRSIYNAPYDPYRDDTAEDMFTVTVRPINDAPVWVDYPEELVQENVGDVVFFFLGAEDPDQLFGGEDQLTIRWGDDDGLIDREADLTDNEDNTADFDWATGADDAGRYNPTFIVEDEAGLTDEVEVEILVFTSNPIIHVPTENPEFVVDPNPNENEELVLQFIADDMDNDPEELRWAVGNNDLPDGWEFDDHQDGEAEFAWTPTFDDQGVYSAVFIVRDPQDNTDAITVTFNVIHVPRLVLVIDPDGVSDGDFWATNQDEGDLLDITIGSLNPDGNDIFWNDGAQDAALADWPGDPVINRDNGNLRRLQWTPPFDAANDDPYEVLFSIQSEAGEDELLVQITVIDHNPQPRIVNPIPDIEVPEDTAAVQLAVLDDVFIDPEDPDNPIQVYEIEGAPDEIFLSIDENRILWLDSLQANYNNNGVEISIVATENGGQLQEADLFILTVAPVNDRPGVFSLVAPEDGFAVNRGNYDVSFEWEEPENVDGDEFFYDLYLNAQFEDRNDTVLVDGIRLTNYEIRDLEERLIENGIFSHLDVRVDVTWWVVATDSDNEPLSTESSERWVIDLQVPLTVPDPNDIIPTEFSLRPVYPNPFNPSAKVMFDLPRIADVKLSVWDLAGRKITNLTEGRLPVGRHTIEWNANGSPAGLYIFVLETDKRRFMTKGALVR